MEITELLKQHPCWCGRPAVEVVSEGPDYEMRGYCHLHAERTTVTVVRQRRDRPGSAPRRNLV